MIATLAACGDDSPSPTSEIEDCLKEAGAEITTDVADLSFAVDYGFGVKEDHGADGSRTLSVGSYEGKSNGGWKIYYVARKGFRVSLPTLVRNPEKAAKVVAYVHPLDASVAKAADACLTAT